MSARTTNLSLPIAGSSVVNELPVKRQKRSQVARACDGCRAHRSKCDNSRPCLNCKVRGRFCSTGADNITTLSQAIDEIEKLRQKVRGLEVKLKLEQERNEKVNEQAQQLPTPPSQSPLQVYHEADNRSGQWHGKKKYWEGIQLRPARSPHETWFGPSSLYHFVKRLSVFLNSSFQHIHSVDHMLLDSTSSRKLLEESTSKSDRILSCAIISAHPSQESDMVSNLSPTQEEYFLTLFWQSYHTSQYAVLHEADFKEHHQSLWKGAGKVRKPSAVVDIVLAICMQYGISTVPADQQGEITEKDDAAIAGRRYYRRCQALLAHEMDSPTTLTLQCHLLSALYLCAGSFHNMADSSCALAVRTAYILGLHFDPPRTMSPKEQEKRRRLWWAVYILDTKMSMKLGRPFQIHSSHAMPQLPKDDFETAMLSGSTFSPLGENTTWLTFNLQNIKLFIAVKAAYTAFYDRDLQLGEGQSIWDDPETLERSAWLVAPHTEQLEAWADEVPSTLRTQRRNGQALSMDDSPVLIELIAPLWLQRRRLLLELMYHNLCTSLYRPFISLTRSPSSGPRTEETAIKCAAHAISLTKIVHQVLESSSILDGWHEVFHWQWNAAMTLIGFIITFPNGSSTPAARNAICLCLSSFAIYGKSFPVANSGMSILQQLCIKIDSLREQTQAKHKLSTTRRRT